MSHPTQPREPDYRSYCLALLGGLVLAESIPPAYSEWIGRQLLEALTGEAA